MLSKSRTLVLFTALSILLLTLLILPLYLFWDLPIAVKAHAFHGSIIFSAAKMLSTLASGEVIKGVVVLVLVGGAVDYLIKGPEAKPRNWMLIAIAVMSAMLLGDELKWIFGRCRPQLYFDDGLYGMTWFSTENIRNSFPSGHTLRAFSLATSLAFLLPSKKWIPIIVAVLIGISRVFAGRHYPSDVMAGAFLGIVCAIWTNFILCPDTKGEK